MKPISSIRLAIAVLLPALWLMAQDAAPRPRITGVAHIAIFAFLLGWNEFLFSLILAGPDSRTLPVLIASFDSDRGILWGQFSAAAVAIMLPVAAFAMLLQRRIVSGLTMGAVKG